MLSLSTHLKMPAAYFFLNTQKTPLLSVPEHLSALTRTPRKYPKSRYLVEKYYNLNDFSPKRAMVYRYDMAA